MEVDASPAKLGDTLRLLFERPAHDECGQRSLKLRKQIHERIETIGTPRFVDESRASRVIRFEVESEAGSRGQEVLKKDRSAAEKVDPKAKGDSPAWKDRRSKPRF